MKIKIFYLIKDIESYENEINEFIKNKKVIDIKHSISSYGMANDYTSTQDMDMSTLIIWREIMLTVKNAIKAIILILTTALIQIETIRIKGHWIFGGNVVFPFLAAMLLWYVPARFKDFKRL